MEVIVSSWNVRGIRKLAKLKQVMNRLKHFKSKIVFLQESHLVNSEIQHLTKRWPGQVHHASYQTHARGVITLIHRSIPFQVTKTIQDPFGRYIIISGEILSQKINLINVYGPNEDNPSFFESLFLTVATLEGFNIIGGDFNCVLEPGLDRSTQTDTTHMRTRKTLINCMKDLKLIEIWRAQNSKDREYSCYSSSYKTHSRIDYFLISSELQTKVKKCWYSGIVISDHATATMEIDLGRIKQFSRWRLQIQFLKDPTFVKYIGKCIDNYFELNTNETTAGIRWEAFKAYIRGEIISYTSSKTKQNNQELRTLENQIKKAETEIYNNYDPVKLHNLSIMRAEYDRLSSDRVARNLMWTKQTYYDQGEKAGKLLAWRIKKIQAETTINSIKSTSGNLTTDPLEINNSFRNFYEMVYKSEYTEKGELTQFIEQLQFQKITEEKKNELDSPLTITELCTAIRDLNSGKAPGPDGLPIEFYKTFQRQLVKPLFDMFTESFIKGILPDSLRLALITVILKPNKPPTECSSYRPISLMGSDTKILCKAFSKRLEKYLPLLINDDQQGFIQKRQGYHNIRRVLNILHERHDAPDTAMLSVDASQAFDRIEWEYLFNILPKYGLGNTFLKWIRVLYTNPSVEILTNSTVSKPFNLQRSTRQGCPLSPLLFTLAIEPLAMAVRAHTEISGITIGGRKHSISLFADDIIFFLTNLKTSIPSLIKLIEKFGELSGYKINNTKSVLMFLNKEERYNPKINTPFVTTTEGFKYLGVKITPELKDIIPKNYDPLIEKTAEMLDRWSTLPVSMIGRINLIKMTVLPQYLYYFQTLPFATTNSIP